MSQFCVFENDFFSMFLLDYGCNAINQVLPCSFVKIPAITCDGVTEVEHTYNTVGVFNIKVSVRDANCKESTDNISITVENI